MTLKVVAWITGRHSKLWSKGLRIVPRPSPDGVFPDTAAPKPGTAMQTMTIIDTLAKKVLLSRLPDVQGGTRAC